MSFYCFTKIKLQPPLQNPHVSLFKAHLNTYLKDRKTQKTYPIIQQVKDTTLFESIVNYEITY